MTTLPDRLEQCAKVFAGPRDPAGKSELARRSNIPLRTFNKYIAGAKLPLERAAAIAKASGKSLMWLATGDGDDRAQDLPVRRLLSADKPHYEMPERLSLHEPRSVFVSSASIDAELLRDVVTAIERALTDKNAKITPEQKAEAVIYLYESSTTDHAISEAALARVLRLVA